MGTARTWDWAATLVGEQGVAGLLGTRPKNRGAHARNAPRLRRRGQGLVALED